MVVHIWLYFKRYRRKIFSDVVISITDSLGWSAWGVSWRYYSLLKKSINLNLTRVDVRSGGVLPRLG